MSIDSGYLSIIKHVYENATGFVKLDEDTADFRTEKWERHGDVIFPKIIYKTFRICI